MADCVVTGVKPMSKRLFLFCAVLVAGWVVATQAAGPTFRPDMVFRGNSLTGWTPLGQADWRAENGEIVGTPKAPGGGWLVLNKSFEDVAVFSNVTCPAGCKAGVLVRAEKTADGGMKGIYVSLTESEPGVVRGHARRAGTRDRAARNCRRVAAAAVVAADARAPVRRARRVRLAGGPAAGAARKPLRCAGGGPAAPGGAPAAPGAAPAGAAGAPQAARGGGGGGRGGGGGAPAPALPPGVSLPGLARPTGAFRPDQNSADITMAASSVTLRLNGGSLGGGGGATEETHGKYGPIALYVGGTAAARFKDVAYADLNARPFEAEKTSANFRVHRLSEFYYSYWLGDRRHQPRQQSSTSLPDRTTTSDPIFTVGRQLYPVASFNPTSEYPQPAMVQLAHDFTGDGWPDVLNMSGNAGNGTGTLFVNPKGESRRWDWFVVMQPPDHVVGNEETLLKDVNQRRPHGHRAHRTGHDAVLDARSRQPDGNVDDHHDLRTGPVGREHQPRHGHRRHRWRRPQ